MVPYQIDGMCLTEDCRASSVMMIGVARAMSRFDAPPELAVEELGPFDHDQPRRKVDAPRQRRRADEHLTRAV